MKRDMEKEKWFTEEVEEKWRVMFTPPCKCINV